MKRELPFNCHDQAQPSWLDRARLAVRLVQQVPTRGGAPLAVSDIGCGDMKLRPLLEGAGRALDYRPFDLVPQAPEVQPLDIRSQALPQPADVAVLLGVVEYLDPLPAVLRRLARQARYIVVSYVVSDYSSYTPEKLRELGWANHLSRQAFGELLAASGFEPLREEVTANKRTVLWLCRSVDGPAEA